MHMTCRPGMWATMVTPFTDENRIDYSALERLMQWYAEAGMDGIFALCYSSEILCLTRAEKEEMLRFILRHMPKEMELVASGHGAEDLDTQIEDIKRLRDIGASTVVLVGNRLATREEEDDVLLDRVERIMTAVPDVLLGTYECPYPFPRAFMPETLGTLARTGRFVFMKETSCDLALLGPKLEATRGTSFHIYNANTATLLDSLAVGAAGYCGIMANFHPGLYVALWQAFRQGERKLTEDLQALLSVFSVYEHQYYPVNAKAYLRAEGLEMTTRSRLQCDGGLTIGMRAELEALRRVTSLAWDALQERALTSS